MQGLLATFVVCFIIMCMSIVANADPVPIGGANCTFDEQCGGIGFGKCIDDKCYCPNTLGGPDCSYRRRDSRYGWLQMFTLILLPGLGNFYFGLYSRAIGQMAMMLIGEAALIPMFFSGVAFLKGVSEFVIIKDHTTTAILLGIFFPIWLIGFLWAMTDNVLLSGRILVDGNKYSMY